MYYEHCTTQSRKLSKQPVNILETFTPTSTNFMLDFCSYNFYIFRSSRSGKGELGVYRFLSKHGSDHYVPFFNDPVSHLAISCKTLFKPF